MRPSTETACASSSGLRTFPGSGPCHAWKSKSCRPVPDSDASPLRVMDPLETITSDASGRVSERNDMLALSIESATHSAAVALVDERRVLAERFLNREKNHSEQLLPQLDGLLTDCEIGSQDLDLIAVSIGPGSFTGLRIGLSTAKALAFGWDLPIQGVNTLDAMAHVLSGDAGCVVPLVNARRGEAYCGFYQGGTRVGAYDVLKADGIRAALADRKLTDPVFI